MTLVNRLIKEARDNPECLRINAGQVREIAAHAHSLMMTTNRPTIEEIEDQIRAGKMQMCGIPVRVGNGESTEGRKK
jgi:kynurenine formamidase